MTHAIISSAMSTWIEYGIFVAGMVVGIVLTWLWAWHRDVALFVLGFVVAVTLGRSTIPSSRPYAAAVRHRPLAMKPWYFLTGMVAIWVVGIPAVRRLRRQWTAEKDQFRDTD